MKGRPMRIVIVILALALVLVGGWALTYPSSSDPKNIKYVLWKAGLNKMSLDVATGAMVGDLNRSKLVVGKTKAQLRDKFGLLLSPTEASPYRAMLSSFPSRAQDVNKPSASQTSVDEQCMNNLRHIYRLLKLHLHHSAGAMGFPSNLDLLYGMSKDPKVFICPADRQINPSQEGKPFQTSYEVVNDPLKPDLSKTPAGRIAIIAEKRPNHNGHRFVLFYDGSVRVFDKEQFNKLRNDSFVDSNH